MPLRLRGDVLEHEKRCPRVGDQEREWLKELGLLRIHTTSMIIQSVRVFTGGTANPARWRTGIICLGAESYKEILCYPTLTNSLLVPSVLQPSSFSIPLVGIVLVNPKAWDEVEVPVVYRTRKGESGSTEHC